MAKINRALLSVTMTKPVERAVLVAAIPDIVQMIQKGVDAGQLHGNSDGLWSFTGYDDADEDDES